MNRRLSVLALIFTVVAAFIACDGDSPLGPSSAQGVVLRGTVLGIAPGASSAAGVSAASAGTATTDTITVTVVEDPSITTTVGSDGSFVLRGLPAGGFTLVFTRDGVTLGTTTFTEVLPNQEIIVTVRVEGSTVTVVEESRNGIGHGDVEIEGLVQSVLTLNPSGESRFVINGRSVVTRPGVTAIREGNTARSVSDLTVGRRVHVRGVWLEGQGSTQPVLAHQIVLQGEEDDDDDGDDNSCMIHGGRVGDRIELEGRVVSGTNSRFVLDVQGNRSTNPVDVDGSGATYRCNGGGPNAPAVCQVNPGNRAHVSGTLQSCSTTSALVRATRVTVQR